MEDLSVQGKVVVVTGAAHGIGRGIALGLAECGAHVFALDISEIELPETVWGMITPMHVDVASESSVITSFKDVLADAGAIDVVFANAGIAGDPVSYPSLTLESWRRVHAVNLDGAFLTTREAARAMIPHKRGKIVITNSVWGMVAATGTDLSAYASSKGALVNLIRHLAVELAPSGVTVNGIAPAGVRTMIADGFYDNDDAVEALRQSIPLGRIVEPRALVGLAVFLSSAASDHITGQTIAFDGGLLAM